MSDARVQAWNATQWLARLAHSYAPQRGRDLTLGWDAAAMRIVTPDLVPGTAVGLSLPSLILQFEQGGRLVPHPLVLDDKSSSEVEAWILVELLHRDIDRERFSKALPYATGELMSGEEPKYAAQDLVDELGKFGAAMTRASQVLARAAALLGAEASLVVWPETLEIGFTVPAIGGDPADRATRLTYSAGGAEPPCFRIAREGEDAAILASDEGVTPDEMGRRLAEQATKARR